ncbi:DUF3472 domain-containing protein [Bowmanella yangjiangensis]|uniref:DUF3472 domain-containing protein n=1 Tax=Bowmanella yangjiangensis TaxID=2811230 RepID=A0ABS3CUB5_9ALTE|nr:DUF3472 domain-containing protein [Bowmanella yangjiangensis]MBN7820712.1 DUF3472 domain-containing protein [Bowmanella yangjiangensis]
MKLLLTGVLFISALLSGCGSNSDNTEQPLEQPNSLILPDSQGIEVPISYNTWVESSPSQSQKLVDDSHPETLDWKDNQQILNNYFATDRSDTVILALEADSSSPHKVAIEIAGNTIPVTLHSNMLYPLLELSLPAGYHKVRILSKETAGTPPPQLHSFRLWPANSATRVNFLEHSNPYWGRRGPSVHLNYDTPQNADIEWFYSEITVPSGQDIPGSYFMANGFAEGYFGIQVNSDVERRVLFSVWSPFQTDDPSQIPADQRIQLLAKGDGVYTGEFGNEGAGGQSYLKHYWQADSTYSFLLRVSPNQDNSTDYSAWFKVASETQWQFVASFKRPQTSTYATRLHSFLENFLTQYGDQPRSASYQNQWVRDTNEQWHELTHARFSVDATGRDENRLDFQGGSTNEVFYLRNGGFIYPQTTPDSRFDRQPSAQTPDLELPSLP